MITHDVMSYFVHCINSGINMSNKHFLVKTAPGSLCQKAFAYMTYSKCMTFQFNKCLLKEIKSGLLNLVKTMLLNQI